MSTSAEIQISDTHIGSRYAIMHPLNAADYQPNKVQKWLFKVWKDEFLPDVEKILDEWKPDYVHLSELGDMGDIDYRGRAPEEKWTQINTDIVENAGRLFEPLYKLVDGVHVVRGTKAHVGEEGGMDERIAADCDKIIPTNTLKSDGEFIKAGWYSEFSMSEVSFEIAHHGKNRSKWTDINLLVALGKEIILKRTQSGDKIPDVVSRGHFHYGEHTPFDKLPYVVAVPGWMIPNSYVYRIDATVETPHVGGHIIIVKDGEIVSVKRLRYFPEREEIKCLQK